jgi:adenylyltransferase/sulfurtransferase
VTGLSAAERSRYSRHLSLEEIGLAGQLTLRAARVLIVGTGGLGSPASLYLAAAGVGTIGLVDCDRVDASNLQRQVLFDTATVGQLKTLAARERLLAINPHVVVHAHQVELCAANVRALFEDYDLVLDGSDRVSTRYLVNDACVLYAKPLVSAAIHRFEGQAMSYVPGRAPCYRCLFPESAEGQLPSCAATGVLGVLPGVLGSLQATEAIKLLLGIGEPLLGRLLTYDALALRFSEFRFQRRSDCAVCGEHPSITAPLDPRGFCTAAELAQVPELTPAQLAATLRQATPGICLIDVREAGEFAAGHLSAAINLPLRELEQDASRIPRAGAPVFVCRSGTRSRRACALALRAGFGDARALAGGLLAWRESEESSLALR